MYFQVLFQTLVIPIAIFVDGSGTNPKSHMQKQQHKLWEPNVWIYAVGLGFCAYKEMKPLILTITVFFNQATQLHL